MPKWIVWALLEFSTFMLLGSALITWMIFTLKKKKGDLKEEDVSSTVQTLATETVTGQVENKALANYLDQQINFAAGRLSGNNLDTLSESHEVNMFKLWGTVLKAERAILLNDVSERPKPILNRFLSNLLYALSSSKLQSTDPNKLNKSLQEIESEFFQTAELLITKEQLLKNQTQLNEDLRNSIDNASLRLQRLSIKTREHQKLEDELQNLKQQIQELEKEQENSNKEITSFDLELKQKGNSLKNNRQKNKSIKQIAILSNISERQKTVIEQLKGEIKKASKANNSEEIEKSKEIAIIKMERMSKESQSVILQLEQELKTSNISISTLKSEIYAKDSRIAEIEKQLSDSNETAIGNLQNINKNTKKALVSLRDELNTALQNSPNDSLIEQDKDTKKLEQLLHESETCVELLAQELETAEQTNENLKKQLASSAQNGSSTSVSPQLEKEKEKNRELAQITQQLKDQLVEKATNNELHNLRGNYNKKSLEFDRLQLAYSDLERKYLGALKQ